jgi:hypothetical protein
MWKKIVVRSVLGLLIVIVGATAGWWVFGGQLPESKGAPALGAKAPDFALPDTKNVTVKLSEMLSGAGSTPPNAVLLVFYRGYW